MIASIGEILCRYWVYQSNTFKRQALQNVIDKNALNEMIRIPLLFYLKDKKTVSSNIFQYFFFLHGQMIECQRKSCKQNLHQSVLEASQRLDNLDMTTMGRMCEWA